MSSKIRSAVLAVAMGLGLAAPAAKAETLADAMAWAYESSGLLEQNRATLRAADEGVAQAVASLRPAISWSASMQSRFTDPIFSNDPTTTANLGLALNYTLYDAGRGAKTVSIKKETVLATRASLLAVEQNVLLQVVQAYNDVRLNQETVAMRENNVRVITQALRAARDRFEVGEVTRTSVAQAEARLASARSQQVAAQGQLESARQQYRVVVGRLPGSLSAASAARITQSLEQATQTALRGHPNLVAAQHNVTALELGIEAARTATVPTVSFTANYGLSETLSDSSDLTDQLTLGISAGGPIYQGGSISSQLRQAMNQRDAARAGLHNSSMQIQASVANAFIGLDVARATRNAYAQSVEAAQIAFDGVREEANLGASTTLDVLDAEQSLFDSRLALLSAQFNEVTQSYAVLASMGLLTAENLGLNVQIYDPTAYFDLVDDAPSLTSAQGRALDRVLQAIANE